MSHSATMLHPASRTPRMLSTPFPAEPIIATFSFSAADSGCAYRRIGRTTDAAAARAPLWIRRRREMLRLCDMCSNLLREERAGVRGCDVRKTLSGRYRVGRHLLR